MEEKVRELGEVISHLMRHDVFHIGPINVTSTVVNTWIVMAILFVVVWLLTRNFSQKPRGAQTILEVAFEFFYSLMDPVLGKSGRKFLFLIGTLFIFIIFLNLSWFIPGMVPPTTDIMTTAALAVFAIIVVQIMGIKENGIGGYIKHFAQPFIVMAPMNIIEEAVKPFSLAIRLFGNMFGEKMVVLILGILAPLAAPTPVMALGVLMGAIQAFIFTLLTVTYLATATHGH